MHWNRPTVFLLIFCLFQTSATAYVVQGKISFDEEWERKIYLSAIPSFEDLNTASEEFIVNFTSITTDGAFVLQGESLPSADRLYRLHICKKGDPAATLFIGGKEENHLHFIMNNDSELIFRSSELFKNISLEGHPGNSALFNFTQKIKSFRKSPAVNSKVNREHRRQRLEAFLLNFIDTSAHAIPAMLALDLLDLESLCAERPEFLELKLLDWTTLDAGSPYLHDLQQQIALLRPQSMGTKSWNWLLFIVIVSIAILWFSYFHKKFFTLRLPANPQSKLSAQERRVLKMVSSGKSNKEISEELNIEVSTVKSHVSNIYSKLGVRSRKEVLGRF